MSEVGNVAIAVDCCGALTEDGCSWRTEEGWVAVCVEKKSFFSRCNFLLTFIS